MPTNTCRECNQALALDNIHVRAWIERLCDRCQSRHYLYVIRSTNDGRIVNALMIPQPRTLHNLPSGIERKQIVLQINHEYREIIYGYQLYWSRQQRRNLNCYYLQMPDSNSLIAACEMAGKIQSRC